MSEFIEPPPKQTKIEHTEAMEQTAAEPQEEWLSEGLLTDEDLPMMDQDRSTEDLANDSMNTNQEDSAIQSMLDSKPTSKSVSNDDIENYLKEKNIQATAQADDVASKMKAKIEELDEFLIKNDGVNEEKVDRKHNDDDKYRTSDLDHSSRNGSDDDGNNTDDLLRMLGDDSSKVKVKKLLKTAHKKPSVDSDGDSYDEEMFENAEIKSLTLAKNVIMKRKNFTKVRAKTTISSDSPKTKDVSTPSTQVATKIDVVKKIVNVPAKSVAKSESKDEEIPKYIKCGPPIRARNLYDSKMVDSSDEENEAEFLDDDFFDLDDNMEGPVDTSEDEVINLQPTQPQILRRPEQMDEEVPSDLDTDDSNASFYNELPSSESEDISDWFSVDIRGERAADYLPMLGDRAEKLLTDERENMTQRLATLRKSLNDLKNSSTDLIIKVVNNRDTLNGLNNMMKDYNVKNCEENSS